MKVLSKQIIISVLIVLALLAIYYGSYDPWVKSTAYITAVQNLPNIHSMTDFQTNFDKPLNYPSPIGQEEVTKFLASDISGLIGQGKQPQDVDRALINYIEPYNYPAFGYDVRHLMAIGQMYSYMFEQFHNPADLQKAEAYYLKAEAIGPKLPPVLYGLLSIYQMENNLPKFKAMAQTILSYWPNDPQLSKIMALLNGQFKTSIQIVTSTVSSTKK